MSSLLRKQPPFVLSGGHKTNPSSLFRRDMQTKMVVDSPRRSECVPCPKKWLGFIDWHRFAKPILFSNIIPSRILQPSLNVGEFPNNVPKSCQSGSESTVKLTFIVRKVHNIKSSPYFVETNFTVPIGLYILLGHIACRTLLFFLLWKCSLVTPPSRSYHTFRQINKIENEVVYLFENAPKLLLCVSLADAAIYESIEGLLLSIRADLSFL